MAQRERRIDGVRLYSDNLEGDNSRSKTVQTYKKVQSTSKTVTKVGSNPTQTTVTKRNTIMGTPESAFVLVRVLACEERDWLRILEFVDKALSS